MNGIMGLIGTAIGGILLGIGIALGMRFIGGRGG